jgi:hypothetical protein
MVGLSALFSVLMQASGTNLIFAIFQGFLWPSTTASVCLASLYNFLLGYLACCSCNFCFLKKWNLQGLGFSLIWQSKLLWLESWKGLLMPVIFLTCRFWFGLKARWTQAPSRIVSLSSLPACL